QVDAGNGAVAYDLAAGDEQLLHMFLPGLRQQQLDRRHVRLDQLGRQLVPVQHQEIGGRARRDPSAVGLAGHGETAVLADDPEQIFATYLDLETRCLVDGVE